MGKKRYATRFLKGFADVLRGHAETDHGLLSVVSAMESGLKGRIGKSPGAQPDLPLMADVAPLLEVATADGDTFRDLLKDTNEHVQWFASYHRGDGADAIVDKLLAAQVVGSLGLLKSNDLMTGFFLIGPNTDYPLHDHLAEELYYVVSGSVDIQNGFDAAPRRVEAGDYSITPSGVPHRLQTGDDPVMILYAWTGAIECDVWWWEHVEGQQWRRFPPPRALSAARQAQTRSDAGPHAPEKEL